MSVSISSRARARELIGARLEPAEIAKNLGADSVNYLPIDEYVKATGMRREQLCLGCITCHYPTPMANELVEGMKVRLERGEIEKGRIYETHNCHKSQVFVCRT